MLALSNQSMCVLAKVADSCPDLSADRLGEAVDPSEVGLHSEVPKNNASTKRMRQT